MGALLVVVEQLLHWWKKYFPAFWATTSAITRPFSAQLHYCGMKEPPSPQLWPPVPFHSSAFLTSQSFQSPGKWISSLASFPSPLPLLLCASCSVLGNFEEQVYIRNTAQSIKEGVFLEHITRKKKKLVSRRINSYFTCVPSSKHFLLTVRTGFTVKQQFTSLGFPSRFCGVLEGLIRSTKIHY